MERNKIKKFSSIWFGRLEFYTTWKKDKSSALNSNQTSQINLVINNQVLSSSEHIAAVKWNSLKRLFFFQPIRTARSFLLALYFSGIAFLLYESLSYTDEFCVKYVRPRSRPTRDSNHKYALSLGRRCKLYESLADDCGRSFLKRELNVLLFFCTSEYVTDMILAFREPGFANKRFLDFVTIPVSS